MSRPGKKIVLAYSGGLDTSIIVPWLKENYEAEVVCFYADVGQSDDASAMAEKARVTGADEYVYQDLRMPFLREFALPALRAGALYEGRYFLGTALARPLIASRQAWCAEKVGADAVAHGCTGKGNDQVRFELTYRSVAPHLQVIAPWRIWSIQSREDALQYAAERGIAVSQSSGELYSRDGNLWHLSHEGGILEDPAVPAPENVCQLTANPSDQPDTPERLTIGFEEGWPVSLNGSPADALSLVQELNTIAGRHGVGRVDIVESRLVGMKSRGIYESPAATVLREALEDLCALTLPHDLLRVRAEMAPRFADLIYGGQWYTPLRKSLMQFFETAMESVTGEVQVELYHGSVKAIGRTSPMSLYQSELASFDMAGYDSKHAEGFIRLLGIPLEAAARRNGNTTMPGIPADAPDRMPFHESRRILPEVQHES